MDIPDRAAALLALVAEDRDRRLAAIERDAANAQRAILAEARATARQRVREALEVERQRLRRHRVAADAALSTAVRRHDARRVAALLARGFERLEAALRARWSDAPGRSEWATHVMRIARSTLGPADWRIEAAPGWSEAERSALAASSSAPITWVEDATLGAGLRIRAGGNVIDATLAALLADRDAAGARLIERLREDGP